MDAAARARSASAPGLVRGLRLNPRQILVPLIAYIVGAVMLLPIWWALAQSLTPEQDIYDWPLRLVPDYPTIANYIAVFHEPDLMLARWYFNSVFIAAATTALVVFIASLAGYAYARLEFPGRDILFIAILSTMMIPGSITMIPVFVMMHQVGMLNTYWALILPQPAGAFGVFLMRQFFQVIPRELEEAAVLDGSGRFGVYWRIAMPLCSPALAALGIFAFLGSWNDFLWPFIAINSIEMRTLPVGLTVLNGEYWSERGLVMAAAVMSTLPVLIVYAIFQRQIVQGFVLSGLKG